MLRLILKPKSHLIIACLAVLGYCLVQFICYLDLNKRVYNHVPGECSHIHGIEKGAGDMEFFDNMVFFTSGTDLNNATNSTGAIFGWRLATREITQIEITHFKATRLMNPHGISTFMNVLMVTNPLNLNRTQDRIDIFNVVLPANREAFPRLRFIKSVTSDVMTGIRGIAAVGKDQFYVANMHKFRVPYMKTTELILGMKSGSILYFDGKKVQVAVSGISSPIGVAYDRHRRQLFVSSYFSQSITVYRANFANLTKIKEIPLQTSPYFLTLDPMGSNLLVATHPLKLRHLIYESFPHLYFSPSQILQLTRQKSKWAITQLYSNDGATISAATTAIIIFHSDKAPQLLIGNLRKGILSCDLTAV